MNIKKNFENVKTKIKNICAEQNKNPDEILLIAVSKTVDLERIKLAIDSGANVLGENRVQEAEQKFETIKNYAPDVKWHLIGHLQSNKAKKAVKIFDVIESVDSLDLLKNLNKHALEIGKIQKSLVQVNISQEESKSGLEQNEIFDFFDAICKNPSEFCTNIKILGLMTIGPLSSDRTKIDECFKATKNLFDELKNKYKAEFIDFKYLSMGMSSDYDLGIKNGANIVRVGSAIFGERNYEQN